MLRRFHHHCARRLACVAAGVTLLGGCGTTRSTDSARTATEQLLISDAIDRAVQTVNLRPLAGQTVFLDDSRLSDVVDRHYLISTLRQHVLATGCVLKDEREAADFIVEARAGAVGTDRNDLLFGIPATNVPQILPFQPAPAAIPEVPLAKRRDQRGIAKISMFAYHRESGQPVWQSGLAVRESSSNDVWIFGAGPFQHGTIYDGPAFAGRALDSESEEEGSNRGRPAGVALAQEATFASPARLAQQFRRLPATGVAQAAQQNSQSATDAIKIADDSAAPAQFSRQDVDPVPLLPRNADAAKSDHKPKMTVRVFESPLLGNKRTKTVDAAAPRNNDPIALPQPRYDSL